MEELINVKNKLNNFNNEEPLLIYITKIECSNYIKIYLYTHFIDKNINKLETETQLIFFKELIDDKINKLYLVKENINKIADSTLTILGLFSS